MGCDNCADNEQIALDAVKKIEALFDQVVELTKKLSVRIAGCQHAANEVCEFLQRAEAAEIELAAVTQCKLNAERRADALEVKLDEERKAREHAEATNKGIIDRWRKMEEEFTVLRAEREKAKAVVEAAEYWYENNVGRNNFDAPRLAVAGAKS